MAATPGTHELDIRSCSHRIARVRLRGACLAIALATLVCSPVRTRAAEPDANAIKADMLCNMAKFVQWPDAVMSQNKGQLVVTILGEDDLAGTLANVLSQRNVNGKPVYVRFARRVQDVRGSQIVYIAGPEIAHLDEILAALKGQPVLTIADSEGFAARGGMMGYSGAPPRVRFEVSLARAEQAGLRISSRLLAIAKVVEPTP